MGRKRQARVEPEVAELRKQVVEWRRTRAKRSRMPEELWAAAARLAEAHGIYRVSQDVGVSYESLKSRLAGRSGRGPSGRQGSSRVGAAGTFVEIKPPGVFGYVAEVEVESGSGAKLTIRLRAEAGLDVCGMVAAFVGGRGAAGGRG